MNKAHFKKKFVFTLILVVCLILFNSGCGLDVVYVLEEPKLANDYHMPECTENNNGENIVFSFTTNESAQPDGVMKGTNVYYRIFKNYTEMQNCVDYLVNLSDPTKDNYLQSALAMIDSKKFVRLCKNSSTSDFLIPYTGSNRTVTICLFDSNSIQAEIKVANSGEGVPTRNIRGEQLVFTFPENYEYDSDVDIDISFTGSSDSDFNNNWYACLFAVSEGRDTSYVPQYSNIVYLGAVKLPVTY